MLGDHRFLEGGLGREDLKCIYSCGGEIFVLERFEGKFEESLTRRLIVDHS